MLSICIFHLRSFLTIRPRVFAQLTTSISLWLIRIGWREVFPVDSREKSILNSLHFSSFYSAIFEVAHASWVNWFLDTTLIFFRDCFRQGGVVDANFFSVDSRTPHLMVGHIIYPRPKANIQRTIINALPLYPTSLPSSARARVNDNLISWYQLNQLCYATFWIFQREMASNGEIVVLKSSKFSGYHAFYRVVAVSIFFNDSFA
jgi:hypothetical protein